MGIAIDRLVAPVASDNPTLLENVDCPMPPSSRQAGPDRAGEHAAADRSHVGPLPVRIVDALAERQIAHALQRRRQAGDEEGRKHVDTEGKARLRPVRQADKGSGEHRLQPLVWEDAQEDRDHAPYRQTDQQGIQLELPFSPDGRSDHRRQRQGAHRRGGALRTHATLKAQKPWTAERDELDADHRHHEPRDFGRKQRAQSRQDAREQSLEETRDHRQGRNQLQTAGVARQHRRGHVGGAGADRAEISGAYRAVRQRLQDRRDAGGNHRHPEDVLDFLLGASDGGHDHHHHDPPGRHHEHVLEPKQRRDGQRRLVVDAVDQAGRLSRHDRFVSSLASESTPDD